MHHIVNPQQTRLFDPFDNVLTEKTRRRLLDNWPGVFRHVILELMPVDAICRYRCYRSEGYFHEHRYSHHAEVP